MLYKPDKIMLGKNLFYKNINNKQYRIYKIDNEQKENFMIKIFKWFVNHHKKNSSNKHYIAIDFEFNKISKGDRTVALMQINLENELDIAHIFILNPNILKSSNLSILIKCISVKKIIKILHGSESLDIPYLYNQLLIDKKYVLNFSKNFYDTKLICDFIKFKINQNISCSIYDVLISNNIISSQTLEDLESNEKNMPPLWQIVIDIYNLSDELFYYSICDVLFLPELIKHLDMKYHKVMMILSEMFAFINLDKRNIDSSFSSLNNELNKCNNYFIFYNNKIITFIQIWKNTFLDMKFNKNIEIIKNINYLKKIFIVLTKFSIFEYIVKKYNAFKFKNVKINILDLSYYRLWLKNYPRINKLSNIIDNLIVDNGIKLFT